MLKLFLANDHRIKKYFNFKKHFIYNLVYPAVYISPLYFIYNKILNIFERIK